MLTRIKRILLLNRPRLIVFRIQNRKEKKFICPICSYHGPFGEVKPKTGIRRKYAFCPNCRALERHRVQYLVIMKLTEKYNFSQMAILHVAPEPFFRQYFQDIFKLYTSMDLFRKNVDCKADLLDLPFKEGSYDFVFASHVLEHIKNDHRALSEIRRVMKSNGIAILPVPIVAHKTIEYPEPNSYEFGHVRAPGPDYYEKYAQHFTKVEQYDSHQFPKQYQPFIYADRTRFPTKNMPLRPAMEGYEHCDIIPVCYA